MLHLGIWKLESERSRSICFQNSGVFGYRYIYTYPNIVIQDIHYIVVWIRTSGLLLLKFKCNWIGVITAKLIQQYYTTDLVNNNTPCFCLDQLAQNPNIFIQPHCSLVHTWSLLDKTHSLYTPWLTKIKYTAIQIGSQLHAPPTAAASSTLVPPIPRSPQTYGKSLSLPLRNATPSCLSTKPTFRKSTTYWQLPASMTTPILPPNTFVTLMSSNNLLQKSRQAHNKKSHFPS